MDGLEIYQEMYQKKLRAQKPAFVGLGLIAVSLLLFWFESSFSGSIDFGRGYEIFYMYILPIAGLSVSAFSIYLGKTGAGTALFYISVGLLGYYIALDSLFAAPLGYSATIRGFILLCTTTVAPLIAVHYLNIKRVYKIVISVLSCIGGFFSMLYTGIAFQIIGGLDKGSFYYVEAVKQISSGVSVNVDGTSVTVPTGVQQQAGDYLSALSKGMNLHSIDLTYIIILAVITLITYIILTVAAKQSGYLEYDSNQIRSVGRDFWTMNLYTYIAAAVLMLLIMAGGNTQNTGLLVLFFVMLGIGIVLNAVIRNAALVIAVNAVINLVICFVQYGSWMDTQNILINIVGILLNAVVVFASFSTIAEVMGISCQHFGKPTFQSA